MEADSDRRDDCVGQVAGECLVERLERLGPGAPAPRLPQVEAERHGVKQFHGEQRQARRVGGDAARHAVELDIAVARQPPVDQLAQLGGSEGRELHDRAAEVAPQMGPQFVELLARRLEGGREQHTQGRGREIAKGRLQS
ncbi:MAG: hypothetical protein AUH78_20990 [Gemmatimonadetes bacterium 13_1_40CM_4_69_8]|nr:MAG: hypothetical protein AUH78_20990 [Gemmatimonadetes bacterium 13_1_40CM_4_69_8]